ncbi:ABC transporter permease [Exiguobacterium acetylicum]|uniref:ABC transporter permease n=1 Tax=Exiguobacterium acetylicum TaxID=41170 RepID=UPI001CA69928|nr:ABC transporter permease [Exiguobacterium acetylicum]QZY88643.1 ABC transporter permease [Exiguobacterium acetylicum]
MNIFINENIKLYSDKITYAFFGLIVIFVIFLGMILNYGSTFEEKNLNWKQDLTEYNQNLKEQLNQNVITKETYDKEVKLNNYRIKNDIAPGYNSDLWSFVKDISGKLSIVTIFSIIIAANIVNKEFKYGTIKNLLTSPISKKHIFLAKYLTVLLFALIMYMFMFLISYIVGGMIFGFTSDVPRFLYIKDMKVQEQSMIFVTMVHYGINLISLIVMTTISFMFSIVLKNSGFAISVTTVLLLTGTLIEKFTSGLPLAKMNLFANLYMDKIYFGESSTIPSLSWAFIIILLYFSMFVTLSWITFTKRMKEI